MSKPRLLVLLSTLSLALASAYAQGTGGPAGGGAGVSSPAASPAGSGSINAAMGSPPGIPSTNFGSDTNANRGSSPTNGTGTGQIGGTTAPTTVAPTGGVTPNQAVSAIQAQGFTDVHDLQRVGNTYTATATQNGEMTQVQVDANTGALIQR